MSGRQRLFAIVALVAIAGHAMAAQGVDMSPQFVNVRLQRASAIMALVPAAVLWVLSRHWRKEYIRAWVAVWLSLAAPLFIVSAGLLDLSDAAISTQGPAANRLIAAASSLVWLGGTALLALSAGWIRGPVRWPPHTWTTSAAAAIAVLAGAMTIGLAVLANVIWIGGLICLSIGAYRFLTLARRDRFYGAVSIGCALLTIPLHAALSEALTLFGITMPDPIQVWILVYAVVALGMHLVVFEDVTYELRRQNALLAAAHQELKARAVTDPLTGCYNRRFFDEVGGRELERHKRHGLPLSLLFVDCDRFKTINDTCGHEMGDQVLKVITSILRQRVRQSDYVFRWGGDEFLVLMTCDAESAHRTALEIQQVFASHELIRGLKRRVALSVGCVSVPPTATNLLSYVREVDARMYAEKTARLADSA